MATVAVTADNTRVAVATIATDTGTWGNDGGGGGVSDEPDIVYQGGTAQSRKVSTSRIGRDYTHGSGTSMTATNRRHWIAKINATNYAALLSRTSPALGTKIGSGSGAYYEHYLFGNDNYPPLGGWQVVAVSPNVSGYRDATTGSPSLTSVLYWSILGDFSATSKAENVVIDAIDIGAGLHLVGGDGASTDGLFQDFVDADQGTTSNRWGFVTTRGPVLYVTGRLAIGQNTTPTAVATVFQDTGVTVVWENGLVETGFHELLFDLGSATTDIDLTSCSLVSTGEDNNTANRGYTTTEDSRTVLTVTGTSGALGLTTCVIDNFASITLTASATLTDCVITDSGQVDSGGASTLNGSSVLTSAVAADEGALLWDVNSDPDGNLDNMTFSQGANAHHAIRFGTLVPATMTLRGCDFSGFSSSDDVNGSVFRFDDTSGTITLNLVGCTHDGSGFTVDDAAGVTVTVVIDPVDTTVKILDGRDNSNLQNARVILEAADGTGDLPFEDTVTITRSGSTASVAHTAHGLVNGNKVAIRGANQPEYNGAKTISNVTTNAYDFTVSGSPVTPATGTITSTGVVLEGLTDVNGEIKDTRTWSLAQPVTGVARKATTAPFFKDSNLTGTISTTTGLTLTQALIFDGSN